jgi:hypothetical protein
MSHKDISDPVVLDAQRAEPAYMWAISIPMGRRGRRFLYTYSLKTTRSEAIRDHCRVCNQTWRALRKSGDRCVRVLVTEICR